MFFKSVLFAKESGPWGKRPTSDRKPDSSDQKSTQEMDEVLRQAQEQMLKFMQEKKRGTGGGNNGGNTPSFKGYYSIGALALLALWLGSGFYMVKPEEKGVVQRFGAYVQTTEPGLHYHLPYPIETVVKPTVTVENIVEVGFRSRSAISGFLGNSRSAFSGRGKQAAASQDIRDIPEESLMLTGDGNIVDLDFTVRWKIADPQLYLFYVENPAGAVKSIAESAMREVIGTRPIDDALIINKAIIQQEAKELIQSISDAYKIGVNIIDVQLQQVDPPAAVIDAFKDVETARQDAEKMQNDAIGYSNSILPRARGEAARIIQEAEAYKQAKVAEAEGAAERFLAQLTEYRKAKEITARRLYLETMEEVLRDSRKVIMTNDAGKGVLPYLPLNQQKR